MIHNLLAHRDLRLKHPGAAGMPRNTIGDATYTPQLWYRQYQFSSPQKVLPHPGEQYPPDPSAAVQAFVNRDFPMPHEYDDPIYLDALEAATALTLELSSRRQTAALSELATEAVNAVFCTCVTTAADAAINRRAPVHAALVTEVLRAVASRQRRGPTSPGTDDVVDRASQESFPASDAPAWIWR